MIEQKPKTALVIVDVQEGMFGLPGMGPVQRDELLNNIHTLIERARHSNCTIIYIQHQGTGDQPLAKTSPGYAIAHEIAPWSGDKIVSKTECGMFHKTELDNVLSALDLRRLVICGMQTEFCVDTAVRTAVDHAYEVIVASGAHATFDTDELSAGTVAKHHETVWRQAFGQVLNVSDISFP
ncbi:MAG: cysteine hydrolase family protein [Pseudomonadota bacterium]